MRAFSVRPRSSIWRALLAEPTAIQAVSLLGGSLHMQVAIEVAVRALGGLPAGPRTYASAFSGFDMFAGALEILYPMGESWSYSFAAEWGKLQRRVLLHAWRHRGLTESRIEDDARELPASLGHVLTYNHILPSQVA